MVASSLRTAVRTQRFSNACIRTLAVLLLAFAGPCPAAVITVTGTGDTIALDALSTLREAITSVNNQADVNADVTLNRVGGYASAPGGIPDVINFNIPAAGVHTIAASAAEPTIIVPLTINGYSQTGASANTQANSDNAVILIQLDGTSAGAGVDGLTLGAGSGGSTIEGLDVTSFTGNGIVVQSNGNSILGNFIGVDPTGTTRMPNGTFPNSGDGIRIVNASNNQIGSTSPADRNISSGNAIDGIHVLGTLVTPATGNMIQGNFVGVAADGLSSVGNRTEPAPAPGAAEGNNLFGIEISGGNLNTVGGTAAGARNVVGFNGDGIELNNGGQQNIIQGNFSGVGADGATHVANLLHGIALRSSNGFGAPLGPAQANEPGMSFNSIGGTAAGAGNLVEFNGTGGIGVFGNPVSASGQANIGNAILGNSVFENGRNFATASSAPTPLLGIDLTNGFAFPRDDGLTANDANGHGAPNDPNNFQNFPVLTSVLSDNTQTTISGTLTQAVSPNTTFRIEFFANDTDPLALPPEGQQFLGFVNATTDGSGIASFSPSLSIPVAPGRIVTATASDPNSNTSEFSAGRAVVAPTPPTIAKAFGATSIALNASTSLTFIIGNPNASTALSGIGFTDTLPAGLVVSTPNGLAGSCGGGTITASAGSSSIDLTGATLAASASCSFSVNVTGVTAGTLINTTTAVTSTEGGNGGTATATLTVVAPPTITKGFNPTTIGPAGTSTLTFTIANSNSSGLTGIAFNDAFPAGLVVAATPNVSNTCGGTFTATANAVSVDLSGGTLSGASCTISVDVHGTATGTMNNTTGSISSTEGGTGTVSNTAGITVSATPVRLQAFDVD